MNKVAADVIDPQAWIEESAELAKRYTMGGSLRLFDQRETALTSYGVGVEVGWLALRDVWLVGGWNLAGFEDGNFADTGNTERGPFVSLRMKFDEESLAAWRDLRLDRP